MAENLRFASDISTDNLSAGQAALLPHRLEQLEWLGLSRETIAALEPHVTILPSATPLNLNTASAEAIYAVTNGISMADAQKLVAERQRQYFRSTDDITALLPDAAFAPNTVSLSSRYFEVRGRLRIDDVVIEERSVVQRNGLDVTVLQRERGALGPPQAVASR